MEFNDVKAYLETNANNEDVKNYIGGLVTTDRVSAFLETENGKKFLQPVLDKYHDKGLKTWQEKNLQKLIDEGISKANPQETPEQKQIRELTERLNAKEAGEKRQALLNKSLVLADEKKLPKEILEHFLGSDEESTIKNLEKLEEVFGKHLETLVSERMKGGYTPPKSDKNDNKSENLSDALQNYYNKNKF